MNTRDKHAIDESEWEAQERGMRAALGRDTDGLPDEAVATYRAVAEALMSAPRSEPPDDFAADVVERVARHDAGSERLLSRILLFVFLAASAMAGALYGEQWWQALHQALGSDALGWVLAATGCVTLSWIGVQLPGYVNHADGQRHAS